MYIYLYTYIYIHISKDPWDWHIFPTQNPSNTIFVPLTFGQMHNSHLMSPQTVMFFAHNIIKSIQNNRYNTQDMLYQKGRIIMGISKG